MNIRSYMVVNKGATFDIYVLVEGAVKDCAVYMLGDIPHAGYEITGLVHRAATQGGKISIRDIDALPFKIPSDLEYRA